MADSIAIQLPASGTGAKIASFNYGPTLGHGQKVVPVSSQLVSFSGYTTSFRGLGRAAVAQNILSIYNAAASPVLVDVTELILEMDALAAQTVIAAQLKVARISGTAPTGGTTLTKVPVKTSQSSDAAVVIRSDAGTTDGSNAGTALTATPGTNTLVQAFGLRANTLVGQSFYRREFVKPDLPIVLLADQGLLLHLTAATTASNPATTHMIASISWQEYTIPSDT